MFVVRRFREQIAFRARKSLVVFDVRKRHFHRKTVLVHALGHVRVHVVRVVHVHLIGVGSRHVVFVGVHFAGNAFFLRISDIVAASLHILTIIVEVVCVGVATHSEVVVRVVQIGFGLCVRLHQVEVLGTAAVLLFGVAAVIVVVVVGALNFGVVIVGAGVSDAVVQLRDAAFCGAYVAVSHFFDFAQIVALFQVRKLGRTDVTVDAIVILLVGLWRGIVILEVVAARSLLRIASIVKRREQNAVFARKSTCGHVYADVGARSVAKVVVETVTVFDAAFDAFVVGIKRVLRVESVVRLILKLFAGFNDRKLAVVVLLVRVVVLELIALVDLVALVEV